MTAPPLPASPCVRCKLDYTQGDNFLAGSRFFLSYSGSAPSAGNCATLATDISSAWGSHIAALISAEVTLTEVDVLDIATDSGASAVETVSVAGTNSGTGLPAQVAINVEFNIARRYRGGKPRMFLPPPPNSEQLDEGHWDSGFVTSVNSGMTAFMAEIEALTIGSMGTLAHVNLSYYKGFTNVTNSSGRTRAAPTYRTSALLDTVEGYACKAVLGSQKRRRVATTY